MKKTEFETIFETELGGVFVVKRPEVEDERGFFKETFRMSELEKVSGYKFRPVQENHSRSKYGIVRGIHTAPWAKFVYVVRGEVLQVVVDLRPESPTFKRHVSLTIGEANRVKVFIPPGCGNAIQVLSDWVDYMYLTDSYWKPGLEYDVAWNDPELGIKWSNIPPLLSEKDKIARRVEDLVFKGVIR